MLKLKYLFENYELAKQTLKLYDVDNETLDETLSYFRISSNAIYPFRNLKGKVCFLRLSPTEEKTIQDVESEIAIITWLISRGFNAMKPYPTISGELFTVIKTKWGEYNVSCFEKVLGRTLDNLDGSLDLAFGYGKTMGNFHKLMKEFPNKSLRKDHNGLLKEISNDLRLYNAPNIVLKELELLKVELEKLPITPENYGIVHYDFEPDNVLYDIKTDAFGVIDFDDAMRCWYVLDVVRAIDSLSDIFEEDMLKQVEEELLKGYKSVVLFSDSDRAIMPLMRRLVVLQEYATIKRVLSEPINDKPEWMTEIIENLTNKIETIESNLSKN